MSRVIKLPHRQGGVSLLEVLIVFFVLSIGLLGMAGLQIKSIQYSQSSYMRSQATVAANDMMDRLRLNGGVEFNASHPEMMAWVAFVNGTLPTNGQPPTAVCAPPACTVTITWEDRYAINDAGTTTQTLTMTSELQ